MKNFSLFILVMISFTLRAHNPENERILLKAYWHINGEKTLAHPLTISQKEVVFQVEGNQLLKTPISALNKYEQNLILQEKRKIDNLNAGITALSQTQQENGTDDKNLFLITFSFFSLLALLVFYKKLKTERLIYPYMWLTLPLFGFTLATLPPFSTDPLEIDKSFSPFKPKVATRWDNNYFYIECNGIPDHEMMTGITKWQQQVPIPQCYIGSNAWQIPLNPVLADTPVPVNPQHFIRGAVAIATNGVPIFNPYTNTGVDALVDGQLDNYGGHSGRADDYHYHIAPLHLDSITEDVLPIAWALDGFPIYAGKEPDGSNMKPLDENHGHFGVDGIYHYHGTKEAPYMIGKMVGKVTEDNTLQIIPQPSAKPVRPSLTPLSGATITHCEANANANGYILTYTRNGSQYTVNYSWTSGGKYTYVFSGPSGNVTETYNGFVPCEIITSVSNIQKPDFNFNVYPNPCDKYLHLQIDEGWKSQIKKTSIVSLNGVKANEYKYFNADVDISNLIPGYYIIQLQSDEFTLEAKFYKY